MVFRGLRVVAYRTFRKSESAAVCCARWRNFFWCVGAVVLCACGKPDAEPEYASDSDTQAPTIVAVADPKANNDGWNNTNVSVRFNCSDSGSGLESCSGPEALTAEGKGQVVTGVAVDKAGNRNSSTLVVNIDKTPPVIQATATPTANSNGWHKTSPTVSFICTDELSGIASCPAPVAVAEDGMRRVIAVTAQDRADNLGSAAIAVNVDRTPPRMAFVSPANATAVVANPPAIELSASDESGIAQGSITVTVNGAAVATNCQHTSGKITCSLPAKIAGNGASIEVQAEDLAGNESSASVTFYFDRDSDGVIDANDVFPDNPNESADLDSDGLGNNADTDRDGDHVSNADEISVGTNPDDPNSFPDRVPPTLTIDGPAERSTELEFIDLSGAVSDQGSGPALVSASSDRYVGLGFTCVVANGRWQSTIPLEIGTNRIAVTAKDSAGNKSVLNFNVERDNPKSLVGLTVTYPLANAVVSQPSIEVRGTLRSDKPALQMSVAVDGRPAPLTPTAQTKVFEFRSETITLQAGVNTIYVAGDVDGTKVQRTLIVVYTSAEQPVTPPQISVLSPLSGSYLNERSFFLAGRVTAAGGMKSLTLGGNPVAYSDLQAPEYTFKELLTIPTGQSEVTFTFRAVDMTGQTTQSDVVYRVDDLPPVIALERILQAPPVENIANEQPYWLRGTVSDPNLNSFTINGTPVVVEPSDTGIYRFNVPLKLGTSATDVRLEAMDQAGNSSWASYLLKVQTETLLTVISPTDGTEYVYDGAAIPVDVSVRVDTTNLDGVKVMATLFGGTTKISELELSGAGMFRTGVVSLPDITGIYDLRIEATDTTGKVLASAAESLSSKSVRQIPIAVTRVEPSADQTSVDPNTSVSIHFNRPVDAKDVEIAVHETALGWTYEDRDNLGVDPLNAKGYQLVQVNRSNEPVEGRLSLLPNQKVMAFYPSREFAYGAQLFVEVIYKGDSLARTQFTTRPLPTFVAGTVVDQLGQTVPGVEVTLPALHRTTSTNKDGAFEFGARDSATQALPAGRYKLVVNPDLKDVRFGSRALWVVITPGRRAELKTIKVPIIGKELGFVPLSGRSQANLLNGALKLDLSKADLLFQNGSRSGNIQAQLVSFTKIPYPVDAIAMPAWMYILQPGDTQVEGNLQVDMEIPLINQSYNHVPPEGSYVILTGVDPESYRVVPTGVGTVTGRRVKSVGATDFKCMDAFGYMLLPSSWREFLDAYARGERSFTEVLSRLSSLRASTTPPNQ